MIVRTMRGVGATYEQFSPHSLDENGAMLVLRGRVDFDVPLRVIVSGDEDLAAKYAEKFGKDLSEIKRNSDGSYQLFGNWLKVKWTKKLEDPQLDLMGVNKLLWNIHDGIDDSTVDSFETVAGEMLQRGYTTNVDMVLLLKRIVGGETLEYGIDPIGIENLARTDCDFNTKALYCLLGEVSYGDILRSISDFKQRYVQDPFQKRYGILHGTMALNQGEENWENTFNTLRELTGIE